MALTFALLIFHALSLPIYIFLLTRYGRQPAAIFLGLVIIEAIFTVFYTLITFYGAFGPGVLLFCAAFLIIPISFIVWLIQLRRQLAEPSRRLAYVVGGLLILLTQTAPIVGDRGLATYCDQQTMATGQPIITALEQYKQAHQNYPPDLASLVPYYLPAIPTYNCLAAIGLHYSHLTASFTLEQCSTPVTLLVTTSTDGTSFLRYNWTNPNWSRISFLDGACSF